MHGTGVEKRSVTRYSVRACLPLVRDRHAGPLPGGTPDRRVHGALVGLHRSRRQDEVLASGAVRPELLGQAAVGLGGARHHQEPRGALVEAVDDAGPVGVPTAGLGQAGQVGKAGQEAVDEGPAVVPGPVVHDQPGGLVHHDQLGVLVHDAERDRGVGHGDVDLLVRSVHLEPLPALDEAAARGDGTTVESNAPVVDELGHRPARQPAEQGHDAVHPGPGQRGGDGQVELRR